MSATIEAPPVAGATALSPRERLEALCDPGSFRPLRSEVRSGRAGDRAMAGRRDDGQFRVPHPRRRDQPGPYQLQAAINAVHADASNFEQTDWPQIVALYDQLLAIAPTPVVALNRAVAIGEVEGAAAALAIVDALDLEAYHPFHATRADLLSRLGRHDEAATAYARAAELAPTEAEREFLRHGGRTTCVRVRPTPG